MRHLKKIRETDAGQIKEQGMSMRCRGHKLLNVYFLTTRSLVRLQAKQLRVQSHEVSKIWQRVDQERETRIKLEAVGCLLTCS